MGRVIGVAMGTVGVGRGGRPLQKYQGTLSVTAEVSGPFAIHLSPDPPHDEWVVTHIQTGCAVGHTKTRARARRMAKRLRGLRANWDFSDPMTVMKKWPKDLRERVRSIARTTVAR